MSLSHIKISAALWGAWDDFFLLPNNHIIVLNAVMAYVISLVGSWDPLALQKTRSRQRCPCLALLSSCGSRSARERMKGKMERRRKRGRQSMRGHNLAKEATALNSPWMNEWFPHKPYGLMISPPPTKYIINSRAVNDKTFGKSLICWIAANQKLLGDTYAIVCILGLP